MRNWTENQVKLVLIRHGETQANSERRYLGKTDESLSKRGIEALESYKERKRYPNVEYLFTSPMKRCLETAEILYPNISSAIIPEWEEMDFGEFEYKNYDDLKDDIRYKEWIESGGALNFPGGEGRENFILRCKRGFVRMCNELNFNNAAQSGDECVSVGIIVHGGIIMALLSSYAGGNYYGYQVANGGGYLCRMAGLGSDVKMKDVMKI